ncbi:helix-turn-helix domain-containing protein [Actinophytocola gossypii]|uniref:Helix-turn-helix domain-containing protein n=1 Tax=Actinophytocola gossypii TaxID=2812003 RepID=A0ABT2JJL9_9PSEU|nr:helix-turn-helix transcriptional regulator [Actinophytocola gossypii]MCT2588072.1 helix-turn-helix domain-containing protein [Actinophytocola gossypii]
MPSTPPPAPESATDEAAFVAELRRLRTWSGHSFRQLERQARALGETLPHSTAATMLARNRLPRAELVVAFVRACGLGDDDARQWVTVRAAIADGTAAAPAAPVRRAPRWRLAVAAAAALAVAFAGGTVSTGWTDVEEVEVVTP